MVGIFKTAEPQNMLSRDQNFQPQIEIQQSVEMGLVAQSGVTKVEF